MKKIKFYALHYTPTNHLKSERVEVNGYALDEKTAVYRNGLMWWIIDLAAGVGLGQYDTRSDAVRAFSKLDLESIRKTKMYNETVDRFNYSPVKGVHNV